MPRLLLLRTAPTLPIDSPVQIRYNRTKVLYEEASAWADPNALRKSSSLPAVFHDETATCSAIERRVASRLRARFRAAASERSLLRLSVELGGYAAARESADSAGDTSSLVFFAKRTHLG